MIVSTNGKELIRPMIKAGCPGLVCSKCGTPKKKLIKLNSTEGFNIRVRDVKEDRIKHTDVISPGCECNTEYVPGVVLDPFIGSGTTAIECIKQVKDFIGIELSNYDCNIIEDRLRLFYPGGVIL